jgi:hypothetical protein
MFRESQNGSAMQLSHNLFRAGIARNPAANNGMTNSKGISGVFSK